MEKLEYEIKKNDTISRWNLTDMVREPFASPRRTFEAEVNMEESYVQVVYPVREEFWKQKRIERTARYDGTYPNLYFPFENNRVDLSTFIHTPHYIYVNAKAGLHAPEKGVYPFMVCTCGGVKIWVNGEEQALYAPYTRNIPGHKNILLQLKKGENEIKVFADELAERDVFFYFELRYMGDTPLIGTVDTEEDPRALLDTEQFLKSCYFQKDMYTEGNVTLCYDRKLLRQDTPLYITMRPFGTGMHLSDTEHRTCTARTDQDFVTVGSTEEIGISLSRVSVCMKCGKYEIPRNLFVGVIPEKKVRIAPAKTIQARKRQALEFLLKNGEAGFSAVITALGAGVGWTEKALRGFDIACKKIEAHEDCADFSLTPFALLKMRFADQLSREQEMRIRGMVLGFRYWIDEPGDDVMWYFSENHAFLFHCSQYLWGHIYQDEVFSVSGRSGQEQYEIGKSRVKAWFDTFFAYGFAEWNSATYIPIDLIGFFTLYLCAPDTEIRQMAKRALDFTMWLIRVNSFEGVMNSTYGRIYEETIKTRIQVEPNFIHWISTGEGWCTYYGNATCLYAVSDYEPADTVPDGVMQENGLLEYTQGIAQVKINIYRTEDYLTAGTRKFKPFQHGHQQHIMNVTIGKEHPAIFYINHPGERVFSGENRPSYWAGNGTIPFVERWKNLTLMMFDTDPGELVHYIHAYAPLYEYEAYKKDGKWFFARSGKGYLGCWFSEGYEITKQGANTGKELISQGLKHAVLVKCGSEREFGSFAHFMELLKSGNPVWDGARALRYIDWQYGALTFSEGVLSCRTMEHV